MRSTKVSKGGNKKRKFAKFNKQLVLENINKVLNQQKQKCDLKFNPKYIIMVPNELLWSEDRLQQECFQWAWNTYPQTRRCMFHVPNERHVHNIVEASRMKAIGVVRGVLDMPFYWRDKSYIFKFKVGGNKMSDDQVRFAQSVIAQGVLVHEIRDLDTFKEIFKNILDGVGVYK